MGYCVNYRLESVIIPADRDFECLAAVNGLWHEEMLKKYASGWHQECAEDGMTPIRCPHYAFVPNPPTEGHSSLEDALLAWRFAAGRNDDDSLEIWEWRGEKCGDEKILFRSIAPFVGDGGVIYLDGEDGRQWKFEFRDGSVRAFYGETIWHPIPPEESSE